MSNEEFKPRHWPSTSEEVRGFVGSDYCSLRYGREDQTPDDGDIYTMSAHDIISTIGNWNTYVLAAAPTPLHNSDCAMHNAPAYPAGPCDCSIAAAPTPPTEPAQGMEPVAFVCDTVNGYKAYSHKNLFLCNSGKVTPLYSSEQLAEMSKFTDEWEAVACDRARKIITIQQERDALQAKLDMAELAWYAG